MEVLHESPLMYLGGCPAGKTIDNISFASWGTPAGDCATGFTVDAKCNAADTMAVVSKMCLGKATCDVPVKLTTFGADPCDDVTKWLAASVHCEGDA
jgi:hypothetical protein